MELDENQIQLKVEWNGKGFYFVCNKESTLGEVHDVLCILKNHNIKQMQNVDAPKESQNDEVVS